MNLDEIPSLQLSLVSQVRDIEQGQVPGGRVGVGGDVGTGDGVRDVEFGIIILNRDGKVGVEDSITIAYKQVVMDLIVLSRPVQTIKTGPTMVLRNPQTRPSLGGLDQTKTKSDQTIPITGVQGTST
ncbi:hypothetical protein BGZ61DRAFT_487162 [Ilyonectria robusta]|uniref:uncharacterized protein n=1 Tax=Ilyonectria robusta TaxID=1079257 RepID=UPI001E8D89AD|nr:uncharacterized protein BGZ61DRAFT_487162 [Ilyonectria robusta]KAH8654204.1 hypothetical protein BGZ61DRAFT_487162 [Ilyonectria robusta]